MGRFSVRCIFVPENYDFSKLVDIFANKCDILKHHNQYLNNLEYQKTVKLMMRQDYIDAGTLLFVESDSLFPPISVVNFIRYQKLYELDFFIESNKNEISRIVSSSKIHYGNSVFGESNNVSAFDLLKDESLRLLLF